MVELLLTYRVTWLIDWVLLTESWHSGYPHGACCRDTYKGLVDVLPDIRHDLSAVAAGQDRVQGVPLDGLQQASRVPQP